MNTFSPTESGVSPDLLLQILDLPLSFHRCLVPITGSVTAALFLSQAIYTAQEVDPTLREWFAKSQAQWAEDTGLTRWEQETARRLLRDAGFLEEQRVGLPAKLYYRVCLERIWAALQGAAVADVRR